VDVEQCKDLKQKLENFATKKKSTIEALDKVLLEKKLFDNFDENTKQEDMKELLKQARHLHLDCSQEAVDKATTNLRKTEGLVGISLGDCRATFTRVTEEGEVCKEWVVRVQPVEEVPELVVTQEMHTRATPGSDQMARIDRVKLQVEGIDTDEDFEEARRICEEEREVQRFTHLVVSYLPLAEERERVVRRAARGGHCVRRGHTLEFSNSLSIPLFSVCLRIRMSLRQGSGWRSSPSLHQSHPLHSPALLPHPSSPPVPYLLPLLLSLFLSFSCLILSPSSLLLSQARGEGGETLLEFEIFFHTFLMSQSLHIVLITTVVFMLKHPLQAVESTAWSGC